MTMSGLNLSALAVRERAVTLFLLLAISVAGVVAFFSLGRAEDPSFTIKQMTVVTVWPGATAKEMEELVAERLEKRMQELRWYDRSETFTRPGLAFTMVVLRDSTPPADVPEEFYQARKKLGDESAHLPRGVIGPMVNDEYSDVTFALYALKAKGEPHRTLVRDAEVLRQRLLHVPGVKKVNIIGEQAERIFVEFSSDRLATLGVSPRDLFAALNSRNVMTPAGSIDAKGPQVFIRLDGAIDDLEEIRNTPRRRTGPYAHARRHRRRDAGLRGSGDLPDPQQRRTDLAARRRSCARRGTASSLARRWRTEAAAINAEMPLGMSPLQGHGPVRQHSDRRRRVHGQVLLRPRRGDARELPQHGMARRHRRGRRGSSHAWRPCSSSWRDRQGLRPDHAGLVDPRARTPGRRRDHRHRDDGGEDGRRLRPHRGGGLCVESHGRTHACRHPGDRDRLHAERLRQVDGRRVHQQHVLDRRHRADRVLDCRGRVHALPGGEAAPEHREARGRARGHLRYAALQPVSPVLGLVIRRKWLVAGGVVGAFVIAVLGMGVVTQQFFPTSDRPEVLVEVQMPYGTSIEQTSAATAKVEAWLARQPEARVVTAYVGQGAPRFYLAMAPELPDSVVREDRRLDGRTKRRAKPSSSGCVRQVADGLAPEARVRVTQLVFGPPRRSRWRSE
jgi:hypothetical protein